MSGNKKNLPLAVIIALAIPFFAYFGWKYIMNNITGSEALSLPQKMYKQGVLEINGNDTVFKYHTIPNFTFINQYGDSVNRDDLKGKIWVCNFFFTHCPGICPKMSENLQRIQTDFVRDNVLILSHTVDPKRDTVERLREYANDYSAIPGKWHFLRSETQEIMFQHGQKGYYVTTKEDEGGAEEFLHSGKFILVDQDMNIIGYYNGLDSLEVNRLMSDIVLLLESED